MRTLTAFTVVIATATAAIGQSRNVPPVVPIQVTDADAYAIYAALVPQAWSNVSKDALLLQRETETTTPCNVRPPADPEWLAVYKDFNQQNSRPQLLERELPVTIPYRLIARAELDADDARLAIKYPGIWQRRPESIEYAAVSAVGFSADKTKAVVYVRLRGSGEFHSMERRAGAWVKVYPGKMGCMWIA